MTNSSLNAFVAIRTAMERFESAPHIEPNASIHVDQAFLPEGHRGILDFKRQLVVGNRGMGKSFWTHALANTHLRRRLAKSYHLPFLASSQVVIGFNGSEKRIPFAPSKDEITDAMRAGRDADLIWRAVLSRAAFTITRPEEPHSDFAEIMDALAESPKQYSEVLSEADDALLATNRNLVIVFDALDQLALDWTDIRQLTRALLLRAVGLQSFRAIKMKIFMRADQFSDAELFRFPDASKIRNDHVNLIWQAHELYGLLLFEILRDNDGGPALTAWANYVKSSGALPRHGRLDKALLFEQINLINSLAGEFMGTHKKRGRVYTWVPLHLSDAANTCSPRTFLTAWKTAAAHIPPPSNRAVDHLGLIEGVRTASTDRLTELREDYPWIDHALGALQGKFVPITKDDLFEVWRQARVTQTILSEASANPKNAPVGLTNPERLEDLLSVMKSIAVMEERVSGKINVPDIFRVEAKILRRGGVAVPQRN